MLNISIGLLMAKEVPIVTAIDKYNNVWFPAWKFRNVLDVVATVTMKIVNASWMVSSE